MVDARGVVVVVVVVVAAIVGAADVSVVETVVAPTALVDGTTEIDAG